MERLEKVIRCMGYQFVIDELVKWMPTDELEEFVDDLEKDADMIEEAL